MNKEVLDLLQQCHIEIADQVSDSLEDILDESDDVFFKLAQNTDGENNSSYFATMRELRRNREQIIELFKSNYIELHGNKTLQDSKDDELDLALKTTTRRINKHCHDMLDGLNKTINQNIDDSQHLETVDIPASPLLISRAFLNAFNNAETDIESKLILLKVFEQHITEPLNKIYSSLGDNLEDSFLKFEREKSVPVNEKLEKLASIRDKIINRPEEAKSISDKIIVKPEESNSYADKIIYRPEEAPHNDIGDETQESIRQSANASDEDQKNHFLRATGNVRQQIKQHLGEADVPEYVSEFLFNHWSKLLLKIYLKGGIDSKNWTNAIEVVDELALAIGSQSTIIEKREYTEFPYLLERIKNGLNAISVSQSVYLEFETRISSDYNEIIEEDDIEQEDKTDITSIEQSIEDTLSVSQENRIASRAPLFQDELLKK